MPILDGGSPLRVYGSPPRPLRLVENQVTSTGAILATYARTSLDDWPIPVSFPGESRLYLIESEEEAVRDDPQEITELIRAWVSAVRAGELEGVLSAHAEDIVMFDVPPPDNGVRGIDAYRETWPPFFGWLRSGASFDIVELDVTAGDDLAYAWAVAVWN